MVAVRILVRGLLKRLKVLKLEVIVKTEDELDDDRMLDANIEEDSEECGSKSSKKIVKVEIKLKKNMKNKFVKRCGIKLI